MEMTSLVESTTSPGLNAGIVKRLVILQGSVQKGRTRKMKKKHVNNANVAKEDDKSSDGDLYFVSSVEQIMRTLGDVRYIPDLKKNLISLGTHDSIDCSISIKGGVMKVNKGAMVIMKGQKTGNLYKLMGNTIIGGALVLTHTGYSSDNSELWHKRLGHLCEGDMLELHKRKLLQGMKLCKLDFYKFCVFGKQKRVSFKDASYTSKGVLDYVHSDVWGPIKHVANGGAHYFVAFIGDFSKKVYVYFMKHKSEVFNVFKQWKARVEYQKGKNHKYFQKAPEVRKDAKENLREDLLWCWLNVHPLTFVSICKEDMTESHEKLGFLGRDQSY
ncbi:hypothetical protein RJ640_004024 [Escallonia rubra]|uniref:GAG-pre-integrase domain-containing protein n=1 Tax=Escallonia rubra TaxID=112253 RepID=A0AA88R0W7_9ASTE|nr:hypothetical protein RJ640_004024 [Escallonia rubra]